MFTILTPTHAGDYERFCLLRESIRRCEITFPHVAVVTEADRGVFANLPDKKNLTILSHDEVLPRSIVKRLAVWGMPRRNPKRWTVGKPLAGWHVQQFIKLNAASFIQTPGIVCIDSDTVFLRNVNERDFVSKDGKLLLYENTDMDAEMAEWLAIAMRFLGVNPQQLPITRFTHSPTIFHRNVLIDMLNLVERRHHRPWHDVFDPLHLKTMEYSLYGVFAKYLDPYNRVAAAPPVHSVYYWWDEDAQTIANTFSQRTASLDAKMMAVQSNTGVSPESYAPLLRTLWSGG